MQSVLDYQQPATQLKPATPRAIIALLIALVFSAPSTAWIIPTFLIRTLHIRPHLMPRVFLTALAAPLAVLFCTVIFFTLGKDPVRRQARRLAKLSLAVSLTNLILLVVVPMLIIVAMSWGSSISADQGRPQLDRYFRQIGIALPTTTEYLHGWSDGAWDGDSRAYHLRLSPPEVDAIAKTLRALPRDRWSVRDISAITTYHQHLPGWWEDKRIARGHMLRIEGPLSRRKLLYISLIKDTGEVFIWIW